MVRVRLTLPPAIKQDYLATNYLAVGTRIWGPLEATKPVILRSRINPSEGKTRQTNRKYYRPFWPRSLTGAAFRAVTGRTVNPQVPGSSPGRGAKSINSMCPILAFGSTPAVYENVAKNPQVEAVCHESPADMPDQKPR